MHILVYTIQAKLTVLFLFVSFIVVNTNAQTPTKKTIEHLDSFRLKYADGMQKQNAKILFDNYSDDIRLMPEFQKTVFGKSNAQMYHKAFLNRYQIQKYERWKIEIIDLDSMVVELGYFDMSLMNKNSKLTYELKGKYQDIWQKLQNGNLVLVTEAWNYNHPVNFPEQLKFDEVPAIHVALQSHLQIKDNISFELAGLSALMENTIKQKDAKIWGQFFADDGMFIYSFNPIYQGRKELDEYLKKHVQEIPVFEKLDIRNDRIDDLKNGYVIEYATHIANWRNEAHSGVSTGKNIRIWRREPNGTLKIFRQMAMYD